MQKKKLLLNSAAALSFSTNAPSDSIIPAASSFDVVRIAPSFISLEQERYWLHHLGRMAGKTAVAASLIGSLLLETGSVRPVISPYLFSKRGAKSPGIAVKEYD